MKDLEAINKEREGRNNLSRYKDLIETVSRVEYNKFSHLGLIDLSEVINLANYAAEQINKKCNTEIKVIKHSEVESFKNSIFVCNDDKYLSDNKSNISYMNDCLNLRGSDDSSTLNALSLFIDHIIHSCDKKEDGIYQIYFPMDEVIENEWRYTVPVFTCGNFQRSESVSNNSYSPYASI